jgi:ABC-type transport system involved in multi-copper enzyme maturation permease subunit
MSALAQPTTLAGRHTPEHAGRITQLNVLRSEWTKLWSLRSTRWTLLVSFIGMAGLGPLIAAVQMGRWNHMSLGDRLSFDSLNTAVAGQHLAQLAIGVLGVLVISGEYSTGMIRSSMMAVPTRLPVLWAKILVYATVTFVLMLVASLISFFAVEAITTQHHVQHAIGDPGALRVVLGTALYMTVLGVLCVGLGAVLRNTAGGIATFVGLLFVLPGIAAILPSSLDHSISKYLPLDAGTTVSTHHFDNPWHLSVWGGFALFAAYAVIAVAGGVITLLKRDA